MSKIKILVTFGPFLGAPQRHIRLLAGPRSYAGGQLHAGPPIGEYWRSRAQEWAKGEIFQ